MAHNLGKKNEALKGLESILDFDCPTQTQATRTFLINQMEIFGAPSEKIKKLENKNGVIGTYFSI